MDKIIIEKMKMCPLVYTISEENGHDCWGKFEYTRHDCVNIDGKSVRVFDDEFIIHDGKIVFDTVYDFKLPDYLKIILNEDYAKEEKEKRRILYKELKKEFKNE